MNRISVIVPVFNVEKYIEKCVYSIINQTYKNLEILLIDDGSTDDSGNICDSLVKLDKRIIVIHKKNGGLSDARNCGLDNATGEYISFVDSDDYIHEEYNQKLFSVLVENDADIVQCMYQKVDELGNELIKYNYNGSVIVKDRNSALNGLYYGEDADYYTVVWNKLYRAKVIKNIRFPIGKIHEDVFTTYLFFYNCNKVAFIKEPMYYYLQRADSIMGSKFNRKRLDGIEAYTEQIDFYDLHNMPQQKNGATIVLEGLIRVLYCNALGSDVEDKKHLLRRILDQYRANTRAFKAIDVKFTKRMMINIFSCFPMFSINIICRLLNKFRPR